MPLATERNCQKCREPLNSGQRRFCSVRCGAHQAGEIAGERRRGTGKFPYIRIRVNGRQTYLHRHVWEQANGRPLEPGEIVHHVNGNKRDNRPANLEALTGRAAHLHVHNYHRQGASYDAEFGF